jgi:DNA ligase-1
MLAGSATDLADALDRAGPAAVEWKLDGVRVQVHRDGDEVAVFTRSLDDITARVPEVVAVARALPAHSLVLDGEAIALRADGRPLAFQDTASRFGAHVSRDVALRFFAFDALHVDGRDLVDVPLRERAPVLDGLVPPEQRVPRVGAADQAAADAAFAAALAAGHEGVIVKALDAPYAAGRRGGAWLKVKPVHTLDLVVLAAEWGHGRRQGHVVYVRPELVVEIAFDGLQRSTRYPGGVALRFARVKRYREDKSAAEADTIELVRSLA